MQTKIKGIIFLAVLIGSLFEGGCPQPDLSASSSNQQGVSSPFGSSSLSLGLNPIHYIDGPTRAEIIEMARMGAKGVRIWVNWREIESQQGSYRWSRLDQVIADVRGAGMEPWALVAGSPQWACRDASVRLSPEPDAMCSPRLDDYERFLTAVVSRYRNEVTYWQVWNEPNLEFYWAPHPDAGEYAEVVRISYAVITALDSRAQVVIGSLAGSDFVFMKSLLERLNRQRVFDGFSSHPYWHSDASGYPLNSPRMPHTIALANGSNRSADFKEEMLLYKELLESYGYREIPLWITEFGWAAHGAEGDGVYYVPLSDQAKFLEETHQILVSNPELSFVKGLFWFADGDWARDPNDQTAKADFGFYGLKWVDGGWKPAAFAFQRLSVR